MKKQAGFTRIELMISIGLGLMRVACSFNAVFKLASEM